MSALAKRSLRIGLLIIIAIPVTVLALALAALGFLHSASGQSFVLSKARAYLAENFQTKIDYSQGAFNIFSGAHFKDLHVVVDRPDLSADINIPVLDLDYELGILSRRLAISRFHVDHPALRVRMNSHAVAEVKPAEGKSGPPMADRWRDLLENPPGRFSMHDFALDSLNLDAELHSQSGPTPADASHAGTVSLTQVHIHDLSLKLALDLARHVFAASGELSAGEPIDLTVSRSAGSESGMDLTAHVTANAKWHLGVQKSSDGWLYDAKPNSWTLMLTGVHLANRAVDAKTSAAASVTVDFPKMDMTGDLAVTAKSAQLMHLDSGSFQTIAIENNIGLSNLALNQRRRRAGLPDQIFHAAVATQKIAVLASLRDKIISQIKLDAEGVEAPAYLTAATNFGVTVDKETTRDLLETSIKSEITLAGMKLMRLDTAMKRDQAGGFLPVTFNGTLALDLADIPALARLLKPAAGLKRYGPRITANNSFAGRYEKNGTLHLEFASRVPGLKVPQAKRPIDLTLQTHSEWLPTDNHLEFGVDMDFVSPDFGHWQVKSNSEVDNVLARAPNGKSNLESSGHTQITEAALPDARALHLPVILEKPVRITHKISYRDGRLVDADIRSEVPLMDAPQFGRVADTVFSFQAKSPDLSAGKDLDISMDLTQGRIEVHKKAAAKSHIDRLEGAFLHMKAALARGSAFTVDEFEAGVANKAVHVSANAHGDLKSKDIQARADFSVAIPAGFPAVNGKTVRGNLDFPVTLAVLRGRQMNLQGQLSLNDLGLTAEDFDVRDVSGVIPIAEKLDWDGKKIHFVDLIRQNPFERVDFGRWQPLLAKSDQLRIGEARREDKTYGPFVGFFEIRQNMVLVHEFDVDLGNGRAYGEMAFDMNPANLQLDVLARITNLNLFEVLPSRFLQQPAKGSQTISARSGLAINLSSGSIDGRVDVTEIGGSQLITMLNLVDPHFEDDKLNKLRRLLQAGYPTGMKLAFAEGYMDMDIDLSILGIPQSEAVHGIPVSSLISSETSGIVQMIGKGPF